MNDKKTIKKFRNNLIIEMEQNINNDYNKDALLYGLTYYYNEEKESGIEGLNFHLLKKDLEIEHLNNERSEKMFFMQEQKNALDSIGNKKISIINAGTSFGKTLIAIEHIYKNRKKYKKVAIILPTNSLSSELEKKLQENINITNNWNIFDSVKDEEDFLETEKLLFIGTQEKAANLTKITFDFLLIDEAYKLSEDPSNNIRSFILNDHLFNAANNKNTKILLLTPNCDLKINYAVLAINENDVSIFKTDFSAVANNYHQIKFDDNFYRNLNKFSDEKTILYKKSPSQVWKILRKIKLEDINTTKESKEILNDLDEIFDDDFSYTIGLKNNICIHHGQMPKFLQEYSIHLFDNEGEEYPKLLIGTNSIAEGINTKTKNVIFEFDEYRDTILYKNLIGRAGRLGQFMVGEIYSDIEPIKFREKLLDKEVNYEVSLTNDKSKKEFPHHNKNELDKHSESIKVIESLNVSKTYYESVKKSISKDIDVKDRSTILKVYDNFQKEITNNKIFNKKLYSSFLNYDFRNILYKAVFNDRAKVKDEWYKLEKESDKLKYIKDNFVEKYGIENENHNYIDIYLNFYYSFVLHELKLFINVANEIIKNEENIILGSNVKKSIDTFNNKFNKKILRNDYYKSINESEKNIILKLKEYGVGLYENGIIDIDLIKSINSSLKSRYSIYDVKRSIFKMAVEGNKEAENIALKYFKFDYVNYIDKV